MMGYIIRIDHNDRSTYLYDFTHDKNGVVITYRQRKSIGQAWKLDSKDRATQYVDQLNARYSPDVTFKVVEVATQWQY